jgi:type IV pilus assembly protein PilA
MHKQRKRWSAGLTLVELMVTLALFAFLMLLSLPLTRAWVESAHQRDASGMLTEGLGRAKALALRNPQGLTDQTLPVAVTCLVSGKISVVAATSTGVDCTQAADWDAQLPSDTTVVLPTTQLAFQCAAYNERGLSLAASVGSLACTPASTSSSLNVNVGSLDALKVSLP